MRLELCAQHWLTLDISETGEHGYLCWFLDGYLFPPITLQYTVNARYKNTVFSCRNCSYNEMFLRTSRYKNTKGLLEKCSYNRRGWSTDFIKKSPTLSLISIHILSSTIAELHGSIISLSSSSAISVTALVVVVIALPSFGKFRAESWVTSRWFQYLIDHMMFVIRSHDVRLSDVPTRYFGNRSPKNRVRVRITGGKPNVLITAALKLSGNPSEIFCSYKRIVRIAGVLITGVDCTRGWWVSQKHGPKIDDVTHKNFHLSASGRAGDASTPLSLVPSSLSLEILPSTPSPHPHTAVFFLPFTIQRRNPSPVNKLPTSNHGYD